MHSVDYILLFDDSVNYFITLYFIITSAVVIVLYNICIFFTQSILYKDMINMFCDVKILLIYIVCIHLISIIKILWFKIDSSYIFKEINQINEIWPDWKPFGITIFHCFYILLYIYVIACTSIIAGTLWKYMYVFIEYLQFKNFDKCKICVNRLLNELIFILHIFRFIMNCVWLPNLSVYSQQL